MKNVFRNTTVFLIFFASFGAFADEVAKSLEVGIFTNSASVSSSPVNGFSASGNAGFGAKLILSNIPEMPKNMDLVFGFSTSSVNLKLTGVDLGNMDQNMFTGGVRYRFSDEQFQPYVGISASYTLNGEDSLANNTLKANQKNGGLGVMFEVGVKALVKTEFIDYVNFGVEHRGKQKYSLVTTFGGARMSDIELNSTKVMLSIGKNF